MSSNYKDIFNARGHLYNSATTKFPNARESERLQLLQLAELSSGDRVCDIPAGGGYVAEGVFNAVKDSVQVTCVEPAKEFAAAINPRFSVLLDSLDNISVAAGYFSVVASLAGLHHAENREDIFREWARVTETGGRLVVADVGAGTGTDRFLNEFVDQYNPEGHCGWFFKSGELTTLMSNHGFAPEHEQLCDTPWLFTSEAEMADFCFLLFGMHAVRQTEVIEALRSYIGVTTTPTGEVALQWQLRYAKGIRQ